MLFNSLSFLIFLPIAFSLYWLSFYKFRYLSISILLILSYFFYAFWDWRFLFLLVFSTIIDYISGIKVSNSKNQRTRNWWFYFSIILNIGFLCFFKYYNFFADTLVYSMTKLGLHLNLNHLNILLPIGISFYTFHGLSYLIDIYNQKIEPEKNFVDYALFVTFFPLLVAGPIERATHLLPQLKQPRIFNYEFAVDGLRQILWGVFKKIVIADQCAFFADMIFNNSSQYNGISHVIGAFFFAFQIYGDFSGYSDIALGTAKLFGIQLFRNFNYPYFSKNIAEFWRRWHISLSSWFKDYLYIPLGGSKGHYLIKIRNILVIFLVSGLWHGANWTFVIWGLLNAIFIIPSILKSKQDKRFEVKINGKLLLGIVEFGSILFTFFLTTFAWIFFRSSSVSNAIDYIGKIANSSLFNAPNFDSLSRALLSFILIIFMLIVEWFNKDHEHVFSGFSRIKNRCFRWLIYSLLLFAIGMFMRTEETPFIYFQF